MNEMRGETIVGVMNESRLEMEIAAGGATELVVRGHSGDIAIGRTERAAILVIAEGFNADASPDDEPLFNARAGNRVTIDAQRHPGMLHADLHIGVPAGFDVSVSTVNGDVAVRGVGGAVDLSTVDGDIQCTEAKGTIKITTVGGDFHAERLDGTLALQTTNGDINIRRSILRRFNVHSVNGDLTFETQLIPHQHYFAHTTNGDIQLRVPRDTGATIQLRTTNGELETDLPVEVINPSRRNWQGRINGGGASVELETLNGDVRLVGVAPVEGFGAMSGGDTSQPAANGDAEDAQTDAVDAPPAEPAQRAPDYTAPESLDILARLERGELTVEEAMEQLDGLR